MTTFKGSDGPRSNSAISRKCCSAYLNAHLHRQVANDRWPSAAVCYLTACCVLYDLHYRLAQEYRIPSSRFVSGFLRSDDRTFLPIIQDRRQLIFSQSLAFMRPESSETGLVNFFTGTARRFMVVRSITHTPGRDRQRQRCKSSPPQPGTAISNRSGSQVHHYHIHSANVPVAPTHYLVYKETDPRFSAGNRCLKQFLVGGRFSSRMTISGRQAHILQNLSDLPRNISVWHY